LRLRIAQTTTKETAVPLFRSLRIASPYGTHGNRSLPIHPLSEGIDSSTRLARPGYRDRSLARAARMSAGPGRQF
jgi:hypothetical protein